MLQKYSGYINQHAKNKSKLIEIVTHEIHMDESLIISYGVKVSTCVVTLHKLCSKYLLNIVLQK